MIVFHAGIVPIDKFFIPYGGLHFGGIMSALECAMRKLMEGRRMYNDLTLDTIHIHKCQLLSSDFYESTDQGSDHNWKVLNNKLFDDGIYFDLIKYTNEYELDVVPSYCTFKPEVVEIVRHSTMNMQVARNILNGTITDEYRYN